MQIDGKLDRLDHSQPLTNASTGNQGKATSNNCHRNKLLHPARPPSCTSQVAEIMMPAKSSRSGHRTARLHLRAAGTSAARAAAAVKPMLERMLLGVNATQPVRRVRARGRRHGPYAAPARAPRSSDNSLRHGARAAPSVIQEVVEPEPEHPMLDVGVRQVHQLAVGVDAG